MRAIARALFCLGAMAVLTQCQDEFDDGDEDMEQNALSSEQMRGMHSKLDKNGDGKVSMEEVLSFSDEMRKVIAAKDSTVLEEVDLDKDGKLSLEELRKDMEQWAGEGDEGKKEQDLRIELETQKFRAADSNSDGVLDARELPSLYYPETHDGVLEITARSTLKRKDTDGDGKLTSKEFWEGEVVESEDFSIAEMEQADFSKLDKNGDGFLGLEELKVWESGKFHTEEAMKRLFALADEDGDMHVSADELDAAKELIAGSDAQYHLMEWAEHHEL